MLKCSLAVSLGSLAASTTLAALTVVGVVPDGPAAAAGVADGDRIVSVGGVAIATVDDLDTAKQGRAPGDVVPLVVERGGETVELSLKLGALSSGGVSFGIRIAYAPEPGAGPTRGTVGCLKWIEATYAVESVSRRLGLDLGDEYAALLACVRHDTQRMTSDLAIRACDNVLKVHCSGVDLLAEIGAAQVEWCEERLGVTLGVEPRRHKAWTTCGEHRVYDRYARDGKPVDEATCRSAFLEQCGKNIDAERTSGRGPETRRAFLECCTARAFERGEDDRCGMIDGAFENGPCLERDVCIDRHTAEWIHCAESK